MQWIDHRRQRTQLVLTFNEPVNPIAIQDPTNYFLFIMGRHRRGLFRHPRRIGIRSAVSNAGGLSVTLSPSRRRLKRHTFYELVINGTAPGGLAGLNGWFLDGTGNGLPGTNYVKVF